MIQYNYVDNEKMHASVSDYKQHLLALVKNHWDNFPDIIPFQFIEKGKVTIDIEGFEKLKTIRSQIKLQPMFNKL